MHFICRLWSIECSVIEVIAFYSNPVDSIWTNFAKVKISEIKERS